MIINNVMPKLSEIFLMNKHSVVMILLLVLALSLVSAVSASDVDEELSLVPEDTQVELVEEEILSEDIETSISVAPEDAVISEAVDQYLKDDLNYQMGYNVTAAADKKLNFKSADDILVITTAGLTRIDNVTTENVLNGIIDASNGCVSYGKGNILTLSAIRTDPTNIAFIVKHGDALTMAFYKNGATTPLYYGNAGPEISAKEWKKLQNLLGKYDAYSLFS